MQQDADIPETLAEPNPKPVSTCSDPIQEEDPPVPDDLFPMKIKGQNEKANSIKVFIYTLI